MNTQIADLVPANSCLKYFAIAGGKSTEYEDIFMDCFEGTEDEIPTVTHVFRTDCFSITLIIDALCFASVGKESYTLGPGDVLITKPETYNSWHWQQLKKVYVISFTRSFFERNCHMRIPDFSLRNGANGLVVALTIQKSEEIANIFELCFKESTEKCSEDRDQMIGNLLISMILKISLSGHNELPALVNINHSIQSDLVNKFLCLLEKNLSDIALDKTSRILRKSDYANLLNVDGCQLSRLLSMNTGKSLNSWIAEKIIDDIEFLLRHSRRSLRDIASKYCFHELNYFYFYFKKHTGISPHNYRKTQVANAC